MHPRLRPSRVLVLAWLLLGVAAPGCGPKITAPPEPPLAVRLGDDAFRLQDYEAAIENYQVYIDSAEHGEYTPFALYQTALSWYRLGEHERCLDVLDELERRYPGEHWAQADALRGDASYKLERRSAALMAWDAGWSAAKPVERPEFRRRIVAVLREMDEGELAQAADAVENREVLALVEHHRAIKKRKERGKETAAAEPKMPTSSGPGESRSEVQVAKRPSPADSGVPAVVTEADRVAGQAEEAARLAEEVDTRVLEAIRDTDEARHEIRAVEESSASFAPLTRVEIPQPPFVERPVPAPKRIIRIGPPARASHAPPDAGAKPAAEAAAGIEIASADLVAIEPVGLPVASSATSEGADIKVACVLPLTGPHRTIGETMLRGIRMVFGAGNPQILYRDTGSSRDLAHSLLGELGGDADVLIVIAAAGDADGRALAQSAERAMVPLLLVAPSAVPSSRYVRVVAASSSDEFTRRYQEQYGKPPEAAAAAGYEAARLAQKALDLGPVPRQDVLSRLAGASDSQRDSRLGATAPAVGSDAS